MYKHLTSLQRSQIFALLQKNIQIKEIACIIKVHISTVYHEIKRNSTENGNYLWDKAEAKARERTHRTTSNACKSELIMWQVFELIREKQLSPAQISGYLRRKGIFISYECIYQHIRGNPELEQHCRHKLKYKGMGEKTVQQRLGTYLTG